MTKEPTTTRRSEKATKCTTPRRIAVVTGTRAEYGLLRSTLRAIRDHPRLESRLIVTGTHLLPKFGRTIDDIRRDGVTIDDRVRMQRGDDGPLDQAAGLARGVAGIAKVLTRTGADMVLVLGDRIEALAGALAGVTTGRLVAHIHGGDVAPGDFDDSLRHAITKLAHLHFPATQAARRRIIQMGESPRRIHVVGAPGLDRLFELRSTARDARPRRRTALGGFALVVQHPLGRAAATEAKVMTAILNETARARLPCICVYPNSDRGHEGIIRAIQRHQRSAPHGSFVAVRSLDHDQYLRCLLEADVLIGNSSSGIIEAAAAGTPCVNVGDRQTGRESDPRWIFAARESDRSIRRALHEALHCRRILGPSSAYGDGRAGRRIAKTLAAAPLHDSFRRKVFADSPTA